MAHKAKVLTLCSHERSVLHKLAKSLLTKKNFIRLPLLQQICYSCDVSKAPLDISQLNNLFQYYSKNKLIRSERNIYAKANEVYDITDSNGQRYYLRILKTQLPENIEVEAQIQEKLTDAGIRTPRYLRLNNNSYVGNHEGALFTLSKYIKGETPTSAPISLIKDFAVVAAKIHRSLEGTLLPPSKSQWFDPRNARRD